MRKNEAKDFEMNTQETELQYSSGSETEYQCDNYSPLYNGNVRKFVPDVEAQATAPDEPDLVLNEFNEYLNCESRGKKNGTGYFK